MSSDRNSQLDLCPSCGQRTVVGDKYCSECGFPIAKMEGQATETDTLLGKTLPGGYRIVEFIAEGSMGRVYRAEQANLGRGVAVKIMNAALLSHPKMVDRFRTEAKAASMLNHPNCMRVYDYGETSDKRPYIVMELLHGKDLELVLREEPFLPITRVLDITIQVLNALEEAHSQGIVHRDLKPANIFILPQRGGGDLAKVVDFGLAKLRSAISGSTMTGVICGTPAYMAPEQATAADTDGRTDLYALGVILFEMIAGRPPFASDDATELLRFHVFDAPPRVSDLTVDRAPPGLEAILDKVLAKSPKDRFENAAAMSAALQEIIAIRSGERSRSWVRTSLKSCSECGGLFPTTARFCGDCGAPAPRDSLPFVGGGTIPPERRMSTPPSPMREEGTARNASHGVEPASVRRPLSSKPPAITRETHAIAGATTERPPPSHAPDASAHSQRGAVETRPPWPSTDAMTVANRRRSRRFPAVSGGPPQADTRRLDPARLSLPPREEPDDDEGPRTNRSRRYEDTGPREVYRPAKPDTRGEGIPTGGRSPVGDRLSQQQGRASAPSVPPYVPPTRSSRGSRPDEEETAATLVHLEQVATRRAEAGDHRGAVDALRRALLHIRQDIDRGELDDPMGAMALFSAKLGEALVACGESHEALDPLREAVSLMKAGSERVRLLLVASRAARESGRDAEAMRFLEDAEAEAQQRISATSIRPRMDSTPDSEEGRPSGVNLSGRDGPGRDGSGGDGSGRRGRINTPAPSKKRSM